VLFSQERVADFINRSFEPVWESVRPVPIVRIDFGNGNFLTRTLHGNILTSVCTADGLVLDALPGIYTESAYLHQLDLLLHLAKLAQSAPAGEREARIVAYHRGQADLLQKQITEVAAAYITKGSIEQPVKKIIQPAKNARADAAIREAKPPLTAAEDVARWKELEEDTRLNERSRRWQIHELLTAKGLVRPDKITRPIYKDVLHADLDDPYLGLGEVLFATYPFAKEDAVH
jgi:hypothetical protein